MSSLSELDEILGLIRQQVADVPAGVDDNWLRLTTSFVEEAQDALDELMGLAICEGESTDG